MKIKLNNNKELVKQIKEKLKANGNYCPCSLTKSCDTMCLCKEFREQAEMGLCHCQLYEKTED